MKKRLPIILFFMTCMVLALSFNASANILNLNLDADCEGYTISGAVDNFCWFWHSGDCLDYSLQVVDKDGSFTVEGQEVLIYEGSDMYECPSLPVEVSGLWPEELHGNVSVNATIILHHQCGEWVDESLFIIKEFNCPSDVGCNRTPGYWKTHPEAWPVEEITIGGVTTYSKEEAIALMKMPVKTDKTYTMFDALIAAKLNVLVGSDTSCIADTIAAADAWMAAYGPVGSGVAAGGGDSPWRMGEALYIELDKYNNGELCVPHCE